ncbi:WecB/TagA/CpsF family glycosyltransferase [Schaalia suimastitidis]|uniref:WecB/TagA/CpsF family glycosyltransferase n=1 Tax=Schaalia suimastitidis TaxID=121163 RepID=UPI0004079CCB|nr:WecB/TagA/CpsF family glycosyltransferase [Schaalia suimastitidis]
MSDNDPLLEVARLVAEPGTTSTWLNHWSLLHADWSALARMDFIGFDGTLLQLMLHRCGHDVERSSADLVLPLVLGHVIESDAPVALIGAAPGVAQRAAVRLAPRPVLAVDGYDELKALRADPTALIRTKPRLIIVGLGAGLQEEVAKECAEHVPHAAVCTAGGWIDQFAAKEMYFPPIIHRLRLGWAWRIAHEPRRLIGRYTVEAAAFISQAPRLIQRLSGLGAYTPLGIDTRRHPDR